ncbi:MAG: Ig-like domain-containing protein [Burkholderiaceae bacterium]|nr:Ig-like domain-containing protein [Burkholderiaceae bacterium]
MPAVPALAQNSKCRVEPFQGATLPSGAVVQMRVVNTGAACAIVNYGVPAEKLNPADSGSITTQAAHGKAEFVAPAAKYTPERGFVGEDAFEYDAFARGNRSTGQSESEGQGRGCGSLNEPCDHP